MARRTIWYVSILTDLDDCSPTVTFDSVLEAFRVAAWGISQGCIVKMWK